jgi:hypothetical protein
LTLSVTNSIHPALALRDSRRLTVPKVGETKKSYQRSAIGAKLESVRRQNFLF